MTAKKLAEVLLRADEEDPGLHVVIRVYDGYGDSSLEPLGFLLKDTLEEDTWVDGHPDNGGMVPKGAPVWRLVEE